MKEGRNHAAAVAIQAGDGRARDRVSIVADVERGLDVAYEAGRASADPAARGRALREMLSILQGIAQDANARIRVIESELELIANRVLTK